MIMAIAPYMTGWKRLFAVYVVFVCACSNSAGCVGVALGVGEGQLAAVVERD